MFAIYRNAEDVSETRQEGVREFRTQRRIRPSNANNRCRRAGNGGTNCQRLSKPRFVGIGKGSGTIKSLAAAAAEINSVT